MLEDSLYKFIGLYYKSPQSMKNIIGRLYRLAPLSLRYGNLYEQFTGLLAASQYWSAEQHATYQNTKFLRLIEHCFNHVPYYRSLFKRNHLLRTDFQSLEDLRKLPFLTKELILANKETLVSENYPKSKLLYYSTGGTTGTPMSFYNEKGVSRSKELAFMTSQWNRVGYAINDPMVTLRGNVVPSVSKNLFWEFEPIKNRLILSTYHMTNENLKQYVEKIRAFRPKFIHTYPSAVTVLAKFMKDNSVSPFETLKAVLCSSEAFYPGQRELLESVFQCRIYSWYGLGEMVVLAGECEISDKYHVFPEYGILEIVDSAGNVIDKEGQLGEIVGTGFDRDIMPFLRYRTGDFAEYYDRTCACGRNYRLLKRVEGRWLQEQVVAKNGSLISITALNMHSPIFENVFQYQFVQEKPGEIILKVVPKNNFSTNDETRILKEFGLKFSSTDIAFKIEKVNDENIDKGKSGKFRFLIQKISNQN